MQVHVLYADLSTQVADITALETIPHTGVLGILVKRDDGTNMAQGEGRDHYAVCWGDEGWGAWCYVFGDDDGDFAHRYEADHLPNKDIRVPLACLHVWFEGQRVTDEVWAEAREVFRGLLR